MTLVGALSFIPSVIRISRMGLEEDLDQRKTISGSEFATSLGGLGLFLIFCTGKQAKLAVRNYFDRVKALFCK